MATREERDTLHLFRQRYREGLTDTVAKIERVVIGGDCGANGYTTMKQADLLGDLLNLQPGVRLLDLGAGRGWPGLYLAASTGCQAVLSDLPLEALQVAAARIESAHLVDKIGVVAGSARALPFRTAAFDSVVQTDVLC